MHAVSDWVTDFRRHVASAVLPILLSVDALVSANVETIASLALIIPPSSEENAFAIARSASIELVSCSFADAFACDFRFFTTSGNRKEMDERSDNIRMMSSAGKRLDGGHSVSLCSTVRVASSIVKDAGELLYDATAPCNVMTSAESSAIS